MNPQEKSYVFHVMRHGTRKTLPFTTLEDAVSYAMEVAFVGWYAFECVTDAEGAEVLSHRGVLDYARNRDMLPRRWPVLEE